ncbi:MAG TPA: HAMP domain-containing sensor histidine kinase [Anaerolineae bacterium]|nr:HAMP domain-containing sensor histidine kinase [Anaerolineae bacterium]
MRRVWLAIIPAAIGLLAAILLQLGMWSNPIVFGRSDVGSLLLMLGIAGSALWLAGWFLWQAAWQRGERSMIRVGEEQVELHRRFIRRLDHELKNRLTGIRAALINLPQERESPVVHEMRLEVNRLAALSADLRKLAELETRPIEQETVDLAQLLTELIEAIRQRPEAAMRRIGLTLPQVPWPLSPITGDHDLIYLALHNLVDNSLKFCRTGDSIEVRTFEDGPFVAVEVADTGPGIHPDDLPHLGEELFRGRTTQATEGSGLGLALVQTIVERHGGTMRIRSRQGQGTVVVARFPAARASHT